MIQLLRTSTITRNQSPNGVLCLGFIHFNFFMLVPNFINVWFECQLVIGREERDFKR